MSIQLLALLGLVSATVSDAHSCSNGQRVTCMPVKPLPGANKQFGHSYGARGTPHCTPEKKKVYCLVKHSYHRCSNGQEPCCSDGSNPWHSHRSSATPPTDALTCEARITAQSAQVSEPEPQPEPPAPVILDDMDTKRNGHPGGLLQNAYEGSYAPCMADAYKGQFHHDWAKNKGGASYTYVFDAPKSGCYKIEEYHPGSDMACSRYLPRNAKLDIEEESKVIKTYTINQAQSPAQWNEIGTLQFSSNRIAKLIMRNAPGEQCDVANYGEACFWVTDAFRLTWTSETCAVSPTMQKQKESAATMQKKEKPDNVPKPMPEQIVVKETTTAAPAAPEVVPATTVEHSGMLKLQAHLSDSHGHSSDVALRLEKHQNVLETSLAAHFGFASVKVTTITAAGRRLAATGSVDIHFVGQGAPATKTAAGFATSLQTAMSVANAGLTITEVDVEWKTAPPTAPESTSSGFTGCQIAFLAAVSIAVVGAIAFCGIGFYRQRVSRNKVAVQQAKSAADELGKSVDAVVIEEAHIPEPDKKDDLEIVSVGSTRSPVSDDLASVEDSNSLEGKSDEVKEDEVPSCISEV